MSRAHLICAAAETPLAKATDAAYLEAHAATVGELLREGHLVEERGGEELAAVCAPTAFSIGFNHGALRPIWRAGCLIGPWNPREYPGARRARDGIVVTPAPTP